MIRGWRSKVKSELKHQYRSCFQAEEDCWPTQSPPPNPCFGGTQALVIILYFFPHCIEEKLAIMVLGVA